MKGDPADDSIAAPSVEILIDDPDLDARLRTMLCELPDIGLPADGLHETAQIVITDTFEAIVHARSGQLVIVLGNEADAPAMLRAGAAAVLPASAGTAELRLAIDATMRGFVIAPARSLGRREPRHDSAGTLPPDEAAPTLTARELDVIKLMAEGASNKMIAARLSISIHTAKFHVASILEKLDSTGRTDAVAQAVRLGLLML